MPRRKVVELFGRGELRDSCLHELRRADGTLTRREVARYIRELCGDNPNDRKCLSDTARWISKCLRNESAAGQVCRTAALRGGALVWGLKKLDG